MSIEAITTSGWVRLEFRVNGPIASEVSFMEFNIPGATQW
jgi:hypothetical protein